MLPAVLPLLAVQPVEQVHHAELAEQLVAILPQVRLVHYASMQIILVYLVLTVAAQVEQVYVIVHGTKHSGVFDAQFVQLAVARV